MSHNQKKKNNRRKPVCKSCRSTSRRSSRRIWRSKTQPIIQSGSVTMTAAKHVIHCLTIVGQIEGHYILPPQNKTTKYEHVIPQLVAIEQDPSIEGLMIILNTVGGDVEAGLAIAELISGMKKPTVSLVAGRRTFHRVCRWRAAQKQVLHRAFRHHDGASGADERSGAGRSADPFLFLTGCRNASCALSPTTPASPRRIFVG